MTLLATSVPDNVAFSYPQVKEKLPMRMCRWAIKKMTEVHRPTLKQQNKPHKAGRHRTKGAIKRQAQGSYFVVMLKNTITEL